MEVSYAYRGSSTVDSRSDATRVSFAPDTRREPTYLVGDIGKKLEFREAISALHGVVVSDLRFKPKDKTDYKTWAQQREWIDWQAVAAERQQTKDRIKALSDDIEALQKATATRMAPFNQAKRRFFDYLYQKEKDMWFVLDPVITVHPDEVFFEAFSQDESTYGRLGAGYEVFNHIETFACGTTNIDYSAALYDEFQKIRTYKSTRLAVDPSGFDVETTGEAAYKEVKIDLPDSWVRGFLQVSSAMSLPATQLELHPMDVYNMCFVLRRRKEIIGPRSMRYHLTPGQPVRVVFEPWETQVVCERSIFQGTEPAVIRVWGRRRLLILERLVPLVKKFTVHLLGTGLPSFYVADLGDMSFTLGLSGWTANDWATAGNFDLMAPRADVDEFTKRRVFDTLKEKWVEQPDALAQRLGLDRAVVLGAMSAYAQAGRAIYDLNKNAWRVRELSREPLPLERLRFSNAREDSASRFVVQKAVQVTQSRRDGAGVLAVQGVVRDKEKNFNPTLSIDSDERLTAATCTCSWHVQNKLFKGPCEHILALRMQSARGGSP